MIRVWSAGAIFLPLLLVRVGESRRRRRRCCVKGCEHQGEDGLRFHTLIVAFPFVFRSNGSLILLLLLLHLLWFPLERNSGKELVFRPALFLTNKEFNTHSRLKHAGFHRTPPPDHVRLGDSNPLSKVPRSLINFLYLSIFIHYSQISPEPQANKAI